MKITTSRGAIYCMYLQRESNATEVGNAGMPGSNEAERTVQMNGMKAHRLYGHPGNECMRQIARHLGVTLS